MIRVINRRNFISAATLSLAGTSLTYGAGPVLQRRRRLVMTVRGPIDAGRLGTTLMHEHVMVDFVGADKVSKERYNQAEVFDTALPYLKRVAELGCRTLVDCTPAYIGRDAALLKRLSEATNLNIITTTGYYGAANDKFVPQHAYRETAEELAAGWINEFTQGIEGTRIKPGIIKIGVDQGRLSEIDAKLVRAAALTHLRTGLAIGSHTGDGIAAIAQLDLISKLGVHPKAFIWIHAQNEKNKAIHLEAAKRGCWVEFDGISKESTGQYVEFVMNMIDKGFLNQTLLSMDAGWYHVGEPRGGTYRGYESLFVDFIPELQKRLSSAQIRQLTTDNPQQALTLQVKRNT